MIEVDTDERTRLAVAERLVSGNAQFARQAISKILKARSSDFDDVLVFDRPEVDHVRGVHTQVGPLDELAIALVHFEAFELVTTETLGKL